MKKLLIVSLLTVLSTIATAQGIIFFDGTYEQALAKAKTENKLVFVDFYADWCAPCKMMSSDVFTDKELGDYFNSKFVSVKINTEKSENKNIVKKYKITSMPTLLFLNADDKMLSFTPSSLDIPTLLKKAQVATGDKLSFHELYEKHKSNPDDLTIMQEMLDEAPSFVGAQEGIEAEKWIIRIEKLYNAYIEKKLKMGDALINRTDYSIILTFHKFGQENDPLLEFMNTNVKRFITAVHGVSPAAYIIQHNDKIIETLARKGNDNYKKYIERIHGDMAEAYNTLPSDGLTPYERTKKYYDAEYFLFYKKDVPKYVELMDEYFSALGDKATSRDYGGATQTMYNAMGTKMSEEMHTKAIGWLTKALGYDNVTLMNKVNFLVMLGDSYKFVNEYGKTKECYNQAYLTSLQMEDGYTKASIQMTLKRKTSALELLK